MDLAVKGLPNKEIARRLGISHRTVEIHRARLMQKTGAQTIVELVHLAAQPGS
jgi:DNA-binding CsgD family transcriptional regulator